MAMVMNQGHTVAGFRNGSTRQRLTQPVRDSALCYVGYTVEIFMMHNVLMHKSINAWL
jgi:hypothetical protein